ncbi:MAG: alpha/beta hydrolase [Dermatophilaceae bacterium]|nr:alpha/beta hydrolase [Dermatophilaceae bacterium]
MGADDAPLMIVHHGAPGLGSLAEPQASFGPMSDTYRVLVFDARGSGRSEGNGPFTHEQWAADVEALRQWAGAERFVMSGGSYGGFISMEYAIRHPERLLALVLRDTSANNANDAMARKNALANARVQLDMDRFERIMNGQVHDDEDLRACWAEILPLYDHVYDPAVVQRKVDATTYRYQTHNWAFTENMPRYDITAELGRITCPTLVTVGRDDWITPVACSELITSLVPGARLEVFEQSGHSPQVEQAEDFQRVVRAFLSQNLATGTRG